MKIKQNGRSAIFPEVERLPDEHGDLLQAFEGRKKLYRREYGHLRLLIITSLLYILQFLISFFYKCSNKYVQ